MKAGQNDNKTKTKDLVIQNILRRTANIFVVIIQQEYLYG